MKGGVWVSVRLEVGLSSICSQGIAEYRVIDSILAVWNSTKYELKLD